MQTIEVFQFRLIDTSDGNQVIDTTLKTPYAALTAVQMEEYIEIDNQLAFMDRMKRKEQRKMEHKKKFAHNPLYRLAYMCGLI